MPRALRKVGARGRSESAAPLFRALGDRNRLHLVSRLCAGGPMSISRLAAGSNVSRQGITKHLQMMEKAGLVRSSRHGRERVWRVDQRKFAQAQRYLQQISAQWDGVLSRLQAFVEA